MAKITTIQKLGIVVLVVSIAGGLIGTILSIYLSFTALETAENAGIGAVGDKITNALFFSFGGIVGSGIGLLMFILGRSKMGSD